MNFNKLSSRDQAVLASLLMLIILLFYGLFRFKPGLQDLHEQQDEILKKQTSIKTIQFPDTPKKSVKDIERELEAGTKEIADLKASLDALQVSFKNDPQDLQIQISDLARNLGVKIRDRRPYGGNTLGNMIPSGGAPTGKMTKDQRKEISNQKRRDQKAARKAAASGVSLAKKAKTEKPEEVSVENMLHPPSGGLHDLIARLSNEGKTQRPLQQLIIETDFRGLQRFISELERLPSFITVVQLEINIIGKDAPQGLPQPLTARLVLSQ